MQATLTIECPDEPVVIAVSGGCDSVTLLHVAVSTVSTLGNIHVVHVNHHLRGVASDDDERLVVATCDTLGVACHVASRPIDPTSAGIEASAREARYDVLVDVAREVGAATVMTAHTADDQAETVLMNLGRGSGLDGMRGMPESRELATGVTLRRPLLSVPRNVVRDAAVALGLQWREDASNNDLRYTRNRIRHEIIPAMQAIFGADVVERMAHTAAVIADAGTIVESKVRRIITEISVSDGQSVGLDVDGLRALPQGLQRLVLRSMIHASVAQGAADAATLRRVLALLDAEVGSQAPVHDGVVALRERHSVVFMQPSTSHAVSFAITAPGPYVAAHCSLDVSIHDVTEVTIDPDPLTAYIDAGQLHGGLLWRTWDDGDRFRPLGMDGSVLVSDLLTNAKVPYRRRRDITVLCDEDGIVWVCGYRLADRVKVSATTRRVYQATITAPSTRH
jgi:tRNA(Ile)-lysidine synthase